MTPVSLGPQNRYHGPGLTLLILPAKKSLVVLLSFFLLKIEPKKAFFSREMN